MSLVGVIGCVIAHIHIQHAPSPSIRRTGIGLLEQLFFSRQCILIVLNRLVVIKIDVIMKV
jgi:hypothetical protein